ncbi:MAG: type I DNA topoisomerase [Candidatus Liptonbacteria bacterium]
MKLVIVESPTKAKTISKFLGKDFVVESSYGHVRDLPKSKLGIDVENDFSPQYVTPRKAQSNLTKLKKTAAKADEVILATDEDREGEAIAWHLSEALKLDETKAERIVFHEITKPAIEEALRSPRTIDINLVNAQQARRVLDRLVGYKLSPFLWKKITRGLSAGRVQSVALRLIVDREEEIKKFKPEEYWTIAALFESEKGNFEAALQKISGDAIPKLGITSKDATDKIVADITGSDYSIKSIEKKEVRKNPLPPFTTSTLQQAASKRLGFSAQKTMYMAQRLYENGQITYMRTDSVNLSEEALHSAAGYVSANFGAAYKIPQARRFKNKSRLAQEAHEAIRPTSAELSPIDKTAKELGMEADEKKVYELIWRRFIASQLPQAVFDALRVEIENMPTGKSKIIYTLAANGNTLNFDGFLKVWQMKFEEKDLPHLLKGDSITLKEILPAQHFTEPPPRYNEASLIKTLEKNGIGRPSTYAPIISVIQERNYVEKQQGRFIPTEMGTLVNRVLTENFSEIVDMQFTANMENGLDEVAEGKQPWQDLIRGFYGPFSKHLESSYETVARATPEAEKTDIICELCGKPMVIKFGRFGKFIACSGFPDCKNTKKIAAPPKLTGIKCPDCLVSPERKDNPGELVERRVSKKGRARGKIFWGCNKYPECKHATWTNPAPKMAQAEEEKTE